MSETRSQPHTAVTGPPQNQAVAKEPMTPVGWLRMQKETPKLVSTGQYRGARERRERTPQGGPRPQAKG